MAIVTFSKNQFEKDFGTMDSKMENKIAMFGTPLDGVDSNELRIEVNPNRPDLLSYHGFSRALKAFIGKEKGLKEYKLNKPEKNYSVTIDSSVKDVRPYTACAIVRGLKFNDERIKELIETQEKLHITLGRKRKKAAIGIYPLEKIKLPITFEAMEPDKIKFVPLESERELSGLEILQRNPTGKEYAHLLAGKAKFPVFLDAENKVLSMPPIINSQTTGKVTEETKDVFVECSGEDSEILKKCLNIIVTSLSDMGGEIYQMNLRFGAGKKEITPNLQPQKLKISIENVNKTLGLDLKEKQLKEFLERMGHNYNAKDSSVEIPAWRTDILHEVDLIEDVAIAYGYDNFVPEIPKIATVGEKDGEEIIKKKISEILSGLGIIEVSNYHLTTKKDQVEKMGLPKDSEVLEVVGSKTEYTTLRENLSHLLLKNLAENVDSEYPQQIFETGRVFSESSGSISENEMLAGSLSSGNFTRIKQIIEYLFRMLNLESKVNFKETEETPAHFIEGRTADIIFNGEKIGSAGEVHPRVLSNWKIKMPAALFEIKLEEIFKALKE
ncbi:MAG: phenylalanine--tRNA ligase subunit beta [Nanoarchaeota archaeon]|nr:phenylalanine--tRNA ligase subunit beta [Nanoarchaeota archaeon]